MRVAIMGYSGSGKSTTAKKIGELYHIPVLHLDTVQFLPNWQEREIDDSREIVKKFMSENQEWVIDGNYSAFLQEERLKLADKILLFDFPRRVCFFRVIKRYLKYKGSNRPDMAAGCDEKMDFEFAKWVLIDGRTKKHREKFAKVMKDYPQKTVRLKNQGQTDELLQGLKKEKIGNLL
ncbi:MAG: DNA topology modulation protein [Oscillospiraceae bacterium]